MVMIQAPRELLHVALYILNSTQIVGTHNGNIVSLHILSHSRLNLTSPAHPCHPVLSDTAHI